MTFDSRLSVHPYEHGAQVLTVATGAVRTGGLLDVKAILHIASLRLQVVGRVFGYSTRKIDVTKLRSRTN